MVCEALASVQPSFRQAQYIAFVGPIGLRSNQKPTECSEQRAECIEGGIADLGTPFAALQALDQRTNVSRPSDPDVDRRLVGIVSRAAVNTRSAHEYEPTKYLALNLSV